MKESSFGKEIARLRKKKKESIREFAKKVLKEDGKPMSPSYLCDIEQGRKKPPALEVIQRMAKLLNGDLDRLMVLAKRTPPDIKEYIQGSREVRRILRRARESGFKDWNKVERLIEHHHENHSQSDKKRIDKTKNKGG